MLKFKRLHPDAKAPEVAHPGEDLAFDVFALKDTVLPFGKVVGVETGISATFVSSSTERVYGKFGLIVKDRSSMAAKGIHTSAGVIDAGYRGELKIMMTNADKSAHYFTPYPENLTENDWYPSLGRFVERSKNPRRHEGYLIKAGDKIAQIIPLEVFTAEGILEVSDLGETTRGVGGFGSTGS